MNQDERFWVEQALTQLQTYGHSFLTRRAAIRGAENLLKEAISIKPQRAPTQSSDFETKVQ